MARTARTPRSPAPRRAEGGRGGRRSGRRRGPRPQGRAPKRLFEAGPVLDRGPIIGAPMDQLSLGVVSRSRKENEHRLAIHPLHLERIAPDLRGRVHLERGYGEHFGVSDEQLAPYVAGMLPRERLLAECDVVLLPKPLAEDLEG